ncbi:MAG: LrgB family protein [Treponema sp.]|jgi:putative effector of murein hydrolase|nr:LrgB family protein [Treponema sp.]
MDYLLSHPVCGILISLACFGAGVLVRRAFPSPFTSPLVIANVLVILIIVFTPLTLEQYEAGGNIIVMFMVPVTVILALRIYRRRAALMANIIPITLGCIAGSAASIFSTWGLCRLLGVEGDAAASLLPKSVTTAIALELAEKNGGVAGIAVPAVIITGIFSAVFSPFIIKALRLKDPVAAGVAMGASGHAIGTAAALELGETEGAMSGIAIGLMGIITSVIFAVVF